MKKIIVILFLLIYPTNLIAHIGHYIKFKKIEMDILRNGEVIGYNNYYFSKNNNDKVVVTNQIDFTVKLLGKTVFQIKGFGEEIYVKDQLVAFNSKTKQNKKNKFVNLVFDKNEKKFNIVGSSYSGTASNDSIIGNWWNHRILQADRQISPVSGSIKEQVVTFVGKEKLNLYGKDYEVHHFKLQSKDMSIPKDKRIDFDVWFDPIKLLIIKVSYSRMGNWEYRLKNFD